MPDSTGPRRIVPVPGLLDIDAVEDANVAEAFDEDDLDEAPPAPRVSAAASAHPFADDLDEVAAGLAEAADPAPADAVSGAPDPLSPPDPPPLTSEDPSAPQDALSEPADLPSESADLASERAELTSERAELTSERADLASESVDLASESVDLASEPADLASESATPFPESVAEVPLVVSADTVQRTAEVVATAKEATASRGRELAQLVVTYGKAHLPETPERVIVPDAGPPRMVGRIGQLIPVLSVIPWVLGALFAVSFWWDFDGMAVGLFGQTIAVEGLLKVLTVSGLIGFGTNWLAITMLFQPREKRAIIPQGLIPAQRERVIYRLSEAISRELINADIIKQKIKDSGVIGRYRDLALGVVRGVVEDPGFRADLKDLAQAYATEVLGSEAVRREVARLAVEKVEEQAGKGLGGMALRLYRTFAEDDFQKRVDRALDELPGAVAPLLDRIDTALDAVPEKVEARADEIEEAATTAILSFVEGFDVRTMIAERARTFDEGQLEGLLKSTSNEQLNYIKYLGAILGVFGGFVIWQPIGALVLFVTISLLLWGVDEALVRARRRREAAA